MVIFSLLSISLYAADVEDVTPMASPVKIFEKDYIGKATKVIIALIVTSVLAFTMIWSIKKMQGKNFAADGNDRLLKLIDKKTLSPHTSIYHLKMGDKDVFIGESKLEIKKIGEIQDEFSNTFPPKSP